MPLTFGLLPRFTDTRWLSPPGSESQPETAKCRFQQAAMPLTPLSLITRSGFPFPVHCTTLHYHGNYGCAAQAASVVQDEPQATPGQVGTASTATITPHHGDHPHAWSYAD